MSQFNWFELHAINQRIGLSDFAFVLLYFSRIQCEPSRVGLKWNFSTRTERRKTKAYANPYIFYQWCVHVSTRVSINTTRQTTIIRFKVKVKSQMWICTEFKLIELVPFTFPSSLVFHLFYWTRASISICTEFQKFFFVFFCILRKINKNKITEPKIKIWDECVDLCVE